MAGPSFSIALSPRWSDSFILSGFFCRSPFSFNTSRQPHNNPLLIKLNKFKDNSFTRDKLATDQVFLAGA